jgi:hypothetical protein
MKIESISAGDYIKNANKNATIINALPALEANTKKEIHDEKTRAKLLQTLTNIHSNIHIVLDGAPKNAAGFVESGAHTNAPIYITEETLNNNSIDPLHVLVHENEHLENGMDHKDIYDNYYSPDQIQALEQFLGIPQLTKEDLIEGHTELFTINKLHKDNNVAYIQKEVPIAQKLDKLSHDMLGSSLLQVFHSGNAQLFNKNLKKISEKLLIKEAFKKINHSFRGNMKKNIAKKLHTEDFNDISNLADITSPQDAERLISQLFINETLKSLAA